MTIVDLILPEGTDRDRPMPWYEGFDIISNEEIFVPAHAVFHPLPPRFLGPFRTSTNGLASGNTFEEAVFHALSEVIERDACLGGEDGHDPALGNLGAIRGHPLQHDRFGIDSVDRRLGRERLWADQCPGRPGQRDVQQQVRHQCRSERRV